MTHWFRVTYQEAHSAGIRLPGGVRVGWDVSEVLGGGYKQSEKMLKELAPKMSPEQLSDAKTRADNWPNAPAK